MLNIEWRGTGELLDCSYYPDYCRHLSEIRLLTRNTDMWHAAKKKAGPITDTCVILQVTYWTCKSSLQWNAHTHSKKSKSKQNKTTTGLREKRMRGRSKDKDGAAEQQERKGKPERKSYFLLCCKTSEWSNWQLWIGRWTSSMSLSLISKHHPYCAWLPRPLTQSQCPCRRQTPH